MRLVREFLEITVGGAFIGVAIESSGHRFGLFHETVLKAQLLMANGDIVDTSVKENVDVFNAMPNSNGTLGRALYLRIPLIPLKSAHPNKLCHPYLDKARREDYLTQPETPWLNPSPSDVKQINHNPTEHVHLKYLRFDNQAEALHHFWKITEAQEVDFIESVAVSANDIVIITGDVVTDVKGIDSKLCHNYLTWDLFWNHVQSKTMQENFVPLNDYFSRWNQTIFWNTQNLGAPTTVLNSWLFRTLFKNRMGMHFFKQLEFSQQQWENLSNPLQPSAKEETIIQDLGIPKAHLPEFFEWYDTTIGSYPIWLCPIAPTDGRFPLFTIKCDSFSLDFGIFNGLNMPQHPDDPNYYNKLIEAWLLEHGGIKAFYSKNCWSKDAYKKVFDGDTYDKMKTLLDPDNRNPDLYTKMVAAQNSKTQNQAPHQIQFPFEFDNYHLLNLCLATSLTACVLTSVFIAVPISQLALLSLSTAALGYQLSHFWGQQASRYGYERDNVAQGLSGWNCAFIFTAPLTIFTQLNLAPYILASTLLCLAGLGQVIYQSPGAKSQSPILEKEIEEIKGNTL